MERFDLFKLHDPIEDKDPRWSWIRSSGKELKKYVRSLTKTLSKKYGILNLAILLNEELPRFSVETIQGYFWGNKYNSFPLVLLEAISKQFDNSEEVKWRIQDKIETLAISRWDSKPIKAVKELDITLCKIACAHAADGSLWGESNLELIDADKAAVEEFAKWLDEVFGYTAKAKKAPGKNAHHVLFKSRIIGRYLNIFLGFPIGKKSDIVKEPKLIKESNLSFRKAFALGVMTFDGSVTMRGEPMINMKSKNIIYDLVDIFEKDNVRYNVKEGTREKFTLQFRRNDRDLLGYFETKSGKYQRLDELINGHRGKSKSINEVKKAFNLAYPKRSTSITCFSELIELAQAMRSFSCDDFIMVITWLERSISSTSIREYLRIMKNSNIIELIKVTGKGNKQLFQFNEDVQEWRVPIRT